MPERITQARFDDQFQHIEREDVTPPGFTGLSFSREVTYAQQEATPTPISSSLYVHEAPGTQVISPSETVDYLRQRVFTPWDDYRYQESLWCLLLDIKNHIRYEVLAYRGTVNTTQVRVAEIFREAVRYGIPAIILAHNHPSSDVTPSPEDYECTSRLIEAGKVIDVELLDHLILGEERWLSLKELRSEMW